MSRQSHLRSVSGGLGARVCQLDASDASKLAGQMTGKRPQPDSEGPFLSCKSAGDLIRGDINDPGSYVEGRIYSTNPSNNQYTVDIRGDSEPNAAYLDVVVEGKLQKRLELLVGDKLQISLNGAHLLPRSGPASRLPVVLRFREGITILLVSRAGPQGEKGKLFHIWPRSSTYSVAFRLRLTLFVESRHQSGQKAKIRTGRWCPRHQLALYSASG